MKWVKKKSLGGAILKAGRMRIKRSLEPFQGYRYEVISVFPNVYYL